MGTILRRKEEIEGLVNRFIPSYLRTGGVLVITGAPDRWAYAFSKGPLKRGGVAPVEDSLRLLTCVRVLQLVAEASFQMGGQEEHSHIFGK